MSNTFAQALPQRAVTLTQELIRTDTVTGTPGEPLGLTQIAAMFEGEPGYRTFMPVGESGQPTALAVVPVAPNSPDLLMFSGHIDVVPAPADGWTQDPWGGAIIDGQVYGRGASDMKSGIGAQISAMIEAGPTAPVMLAISLMEEWGCAGSTDVLDALQLADIFVPARDGERRSGQLAIGAMLVAEPTNGKLVLGHKGPLWIDATVKGRAAHGSTPDVGVSAIYAASELLLRARTELPLREHPHLGKETLNIGMIQGGSARNVVPDTCVVSADMRTVVDDPEGLLAWWRAQPEVDSVSVYSYEPWVWTEPGHPWVQALPVAPESEPVGYGTEAAPLGAGLDFPPTLIWGPGEMASMHVIDEKTPVADIEAAAEGFHQAILAWEKVLEA